VSGPSIEMLCYKSLLNSFVYPYTARIRLDLMTMNTQRREKRAIAETSSVYAVPLGLGTAWTTWVIVSRPLTSGTTLANADVILCVAFSGTSSDTLDTKELPSADNVPTLSSKGVATSTNRLGIGVLSHIHSQGIAAR